MTARQLLFVSLGQQRYRVERPWGDVPSGGGKVTIAAMSSCCSAPIATWTQRCPR